MRRFRSLIRLDLTLSLWRILIAYLILTTFNGIEYYITLHYNLSDACLYPTKTLADILYRGVIGVNLWFGIMIIIIAADSPWTRRKERFEYTMARLGVSFRMKSMAHMIYQLINMVLFTLIQFALVILLCRYSLGILAGMGVADLGSDRIRDIIAEIPMISIFFGNFEPTKALLDILFYLALALSSGLHTTMGLRRRRSILENGWAYIVAAIYLNSPSSKDWLWLLLAILFLMDSLNILIRGGRNEILDDENVSKEEM